MCSSSAAARAGSAISANNAKKKAGAELPSRPLQHTCRISVGNDKKDRRGPVFLCFVRPRRRERENSRNVLFFFLKSCYTESERNITYSERECIQEKQRKVNESKGEDRSHDEANSAPDGVFAGVDAAAVRLRQYKGKEMVDASTQTAPPVEGVTALALCDGDVTLRLKRTKPAPGPGLTTPPSPWTRRRWRTCWPCPPPWTAAKRWPMCRSWRFTDWRLPRSTSPSPPTAWTSSIISATRPRMAVGTCSPLPVRCAIPLTK